MFTSLKTKIILLVTLILATTAGGILYFTYKDVGEAMVRAEEASERNVLQLVQINIEGAYNRLLSDKYEIISRLGKELRRISAVSSSIFNQYQYLSNSGQLNDEVARRLAMEWLRSVDFGQGEVFIFGADGTIVAHTDTAMEGLQLSALRDLKGRAITKAMRFDALKEAGDGAVFTWQKKGQATARKNMGFFVPIRDWQWTLGVTIDFEDIEAESERKMGTLIDVLRKTFAKIQIGENGYAFLFTGDDKEILIPPKHISEETEGGDSLMSLPKDYVQRHPDVGRLLENLKIAYDTGNDSATYGDPFYPDNRRVQARVSYFKTFDWYFAVVVPEQEMLAPAKALLNRQSIIIGLIFLGSVLAAFVVVVRISRPLNILTNYAKEFPAQQFGAIDSDDSAIVKLNAEHKDEVGRLAEAFIFMKAELKKNIQHAIESTAAKERLEREAAEESNKAKSQFLANMSHEIRTPIHGMMGMTEILLKSEVDARQQRFLQTIRRSGEMLVNIVNDILDFSKLDAKKLELEASRFRIGEVIEGIGEQFAEAAHKKGLEMVCDVPHEAFATFLGDPFRLRQVLTNLCGNAIKFTDHGEVVIRLRMIGQQKEKVRIAFEVSDTGIGISDDDQKNIFESFAQADVSSTKRYAGTGLGLAISRKLVELMGDEIQLTSVIGEGSKFTFDLEFGTVENLGVPAVPVADLESLHVLVVDDNEAQRQYLVNTIGEWVERAAGAEDALYALGMLREAAARGRPYDWVIVDRVMTPMSGIDLIRTMKSEPDIDGARIVLMNSFEPSDALESEDNGSIAFGGLSIMKPIRQTDLIQILAGDRDDEIANRQGDSDANGTVNSAVLDMQVLVAEDNLVNQELAKEMLLALGIQPTIVDNGLEAFNTLEIKSFDVVLMDCHMPEMDGYTSTAAIRKRGDKASNGKRLPIIALTANAMRGDREKCIAAGMDDYLSKPFTAEQLLKMLSRWSSEEALAEADEKPWAEQTVPEQTIDEILNSDDLTDAKLVDQSALDQIRTLQRSGQPDLLTKVIDIYLTNSIDLMTQLDEGVKAKDSAAVSSAAHALKSSSANLGATSLASLCKELESMGRRDKLDGAERILEEMQRIHPRICDLLKQERGDNADGNDGNSVAMSA